jgi:hypothetical protein
METYELRPAVKKVYNLLLKVTDHVYQTEIRPKV